LPARASQAAPGSPRPSARSSNPAGRRRGNGLALCQVRHAAHAIPAASRKRRRKPRGTGTWSSCASLRDVPACADAPGR
jgi:hypothetical protein